MCKYICSRNVNIANTTAVLPGYMHKKKKFLYENTVVCVYAIRNRRVSTVVSPTPAVHNFRNQSLDREHADFGGRLLPRSHYLLFRRWQKCRRVRFVKNKPHISFKNIIYI